MAHTSSTYPPVTNPVSIISPYFCTHNHPIDIAITDENFVIQDINGNILFKVKAGPWLSIHDRRVLTDAAGNPIVNFRRKVISAHDRWHVFRGDSTETSDLIFTAKRSSAFQIKTKLDVFLANNTKENVCDFKVKGSWLGRTCVVYAGESSTVVAQMNKKHKAQNKLIGKNHFLVTVYPNIDYAFIISLIVILEIMDSAGASTAATIAVNCAAAAVGG